VPKRNTTDVDAGNNRKVAVKRSVKMATRGYTVSPGSVLGRIRDVALKTVGFNSILWLRQQIWVDRTMMEQDRSSFIDTWLNLGAYFSPRRLRFLTSDVNRGWLRNIRIIDDTGGQAKDVFKAGMLSGLCSPNRLWFMHSTSDEQLNEDQDVLDWLYEITEITFKTLSKTNYYEEVACLFEDAGVFAGGLVWMAESEREVANFKSLPVGSYSVSHDAEGHVCKLHRQFMMTCYQLLDMFGVRDAKGEITNWENFSQAVRTQHDLKQLGSWFYVCHYVRPNQEFEPEAPGTMGMPFLEVYYENGMVQETTTGIDQTSTSSEQWRFLRIRGLFEMPVMEAIWEKTGEDDYGTSCPGIRSIGDVRQLQAQERRTSQASEKMINPAMQGPSTLKGQAVSILAGTLTLYDQRSGDPGFRPAHEVNLNIQMMDERSDRIRARIEKHWYTPLFMMFQREEGESVEPITATEVREKHEEKLLMLSPFLERMNRGAFTPLMTFMFRVMKMRGMLPDPPAKMKDKEITVGFTSIFSQALAMIEMDKIKDFAAWVAQQAQVFPEALDMVDADEMLRQYAKLSKLPPHLIRSEDAANVIRKHRAQQQQAQQQAQMAAQQAKTAKDLSGASTDPAQPTALIQMLQDAQAGSLQPQA
jgi:hypothetical protein